MHEPEKHRVGHGSPPKRTQFKKGQSGNPRGRPKRQKSRDMILDNLLKRRVRMKDSGQEVTLFVALMHALHKQTVDGDLRAMTMTEKFTSLALKFKVAEFPPESQEQSARLKMARLLGLKIIDGVIMDEFEAPEETEETDDE